MSLSSCCNKCAVCPLIPAHRLENFTEDYPAYKGRQCLIEKEKCTINIKQSNKNINAIKELTK